MEGFMKTRVLIVDDHQLLRDGLKMLINRETDMEVVGEAEGFMASMIRAGALGYILKGCDSKV
jgi:DNA-binding NarL/FixJ family response regulator